MNTFAGSTGNDTFDASLNSNGSQTLNAGDSLDGGAGTDTLTAALTASVTPTSLKGIETVNVSTSGATAITFGLSNADAITSLNSVGSTGTAVLTLSGVSKAVPVKIADTATSHTINFSDVTGAADSATLTVSNQTAGTNVIAGVETLSIVSTGSANTFTALTAAQATTLNISGDKTIDLGTAAGIATATTITSTNTAGVTLIHDAAAASTVTGGAGNDSFTFTGSSVVNDSINAGAGNDTVTFTANLATTDTVNGGAGTDTLGAISANAVTISATTPTTFSVSNFETLKVTDALAGNVNVQNIDTGINTVLLDAGYTSGTLTLNAGANTVQVGVDTGSPTVVLAVTGSGTSDSITVANKAATAQSLGDHNFTATGTETLTVNTAATGAAAIVTLGTITVTGSTGATSAETVNFTGANGVSVGVITADVVSGAGLTGTTGTILDMVTGSTATTVTGSGGADDLHGNTTTASNVNGGAGNDTITGGSANDTLVGSTGNDSIVAGGGSDSITGDAGDDTVDMDAGLTSGDTVNGGDGTDVLVLTRNATAPTASEAVGVSGFETLQVDGADGGANTSVVLSNFITNTTFTRVNSDVSGTGTVTFSNAGASIATLGLSQDSTAVTFQRLVDTTSNALAVSIGETIATPASGAVVGTLTVADEETLTLTSVGFATGNQITTLTAGDATSLTVNGSKALTIGTLTAANLATINLSSATAAVSVGATSNTSTQNMTITASATAATTVSGGSGNDTINGGGAADSLLGGSGNDSITGGALNDTITGGTGADAIDGGDGTDTFSAAGMNAANVDGSAGTSTGAVINMGSTALTSAAITTAMGGTIGISSLITSVASNTATYLYANTTTAGSSLSDSLTSIENATGSTGADYIVGSSAANVITGGTGADVMTGGGAADTFAFSTDGSVAGTSLDKISDFNTGGSDVLTFGGNTTVLAAEANGATATSDVDTSAGGLITFAAADDTYAEMVVAVQADAELDVAGSIAMFVVGGNTYVYYAGAATGNADDQIIELTGVTSLTTITGGATTTIA